MKGVLKIVVKSSEIPDILNKIREQDEGLSQEEAEKSVILNVMISKVFDIFIGGIDKGKEVIMKQIKYYKENIVGGKVIPEDELLDSQKVKEFEMFFNASWRDMVEIGIEWGGKEVQYIVLHTNGRREKVTIYATPEDKKPSILEHFINLRDHVIGLENMIRWSEENNIPLQKIVKMKETLKRMKGSLLTLEEKLKQAGIEIPEIIETSGRG